MDLKSQVIDAYNNNIPQAQIARDLGIHKGYVHNILRLNGLLSCAPCRLSPDNMDVVKKLYSDGHSAQEIQDKLNISRYDVRQALDNKARHYSDSNHIRAVRLSPVITEQQKQLCIGTLLGDGSIGRNTNRGYYVQIAHSAKQRDYIEHKAKILGVKTHDYKNSGFSKLPLVTCWFKNAAFSKYIEEVILRSGKKFINEKWMKDLGPEGIAYWFMDDGSSSVYSAHFHTQGFLLEENQILQAKLETYGVHTTLHKTNDGHGHFIYVRSSGREILYDMIEPFIIPSMKYKMKRRKN